MISERCGGIRLRYYCRLRGCAVVRSNLTVNVLKFTSVPRLAASAPTATMPVEPLSISMLEFCNQEPLLIQEGKEFNWKSSRLQYTYSPVLWNIVNGWE